MVLLGRNEGAGGLVAVATLEGDLVLLLVVGGSEVEELARMS
jgi:hypothetical protein